MLSALEVRGGERLILSTTAAAGHGAGFLEMKSLSLANISMMSVVVTRGHRGRVLEGWFTSTFQLLLSDQVVFRSGSGM